ncbi:GntR family transcriptional regulator [Tropicimonas sp. S265A]|uniref:GntR family transcriptional regulator n=1 Tax=Tropicimonas sp. S265A TaxID=3415134 RepID=UPI003C7D2848
MNDASQRMNAAELAYRTIRARIVSGELAEGERLTEKRLSKDLSLSRTPIREAIGRLVLEGLVERQSGYTTKVASFPEDEVEQIFELRRLLEAYSARRAALNASNEDIAMLRDIHATMRAHTPPRTEEEYQVLTEANEQFHRVILQAAGAPRLTALMTLAFDVGMVVRTYRIFSDKDLQRSLQHHAELIDALEAHAPDWAENVMSAHMLAGAAKVNDWLEAKSAAARDLIQSPISGAE